MTEKEKIDLKAAEQCLKKSLDLIDEARKPKGGAAAVKESNIRHSFTSYLRLIFPDVPWWVEDHISRGEANSAFSVKGKAKIGFVDNLVGLTAIEYEGDLLDKAKFAEGFGQVRNYSASLVNKGYDPELIVGILSDTVRWRAYRINGIAGVEGMLGGEHLDLLEIEQVDLSAANETAARSLVGFLLRHLGRKGSRPLGANTIAKDLGLDSAFCGLHAGQLHKLVEKAFKANPKYADLIAKLWCRFVTYLRERGSTDSFQLSGYADELYILTLAKLLCANIIERRALLSSDPEIEAILDGRYFQSKGLINLVEYDYFGWLNHSPFIQDIVPVARGIQADLEAYDFASPATEDLFGMMMSQLAKRTQRLLLGQEWTPSWLAGHLVGHVLDKVPPGEDPQLVDMCCGSGAMIVEAVKRTKSRIESSSTKIDSGQRIQKLAQAITGFDIDPLAVMLSKINWVLASRDWLHAAGGIPVSIPVYHADSLFAITPLSDSVDDSNENGVHKLQIAEHSVDLPTFLLSPKAQPLFDAMLDRAYSMAMASAKAATAYPAKDIQTAIESASAEASAKVSEKEYEALTQFLPSLIGVIDALNRDGRNGIWIFVLRNSYRPGLVAGQFNGLVSNPPWLALSKIADNPYKEALRHHAEAFGIKPAGQSHLHIELATIFLLHAINRYLAPNAEIGCIVPDTVLNGHHHNPFRLGAYASADPAINFSVEELWRVNKGTFKNEACVLFGRKVPLTPGAPNPIPGALAEESGLKPLTFERIERGNRVAWTDSKATLKGMKGFFNPAPFHQGADVMPRTLLFHEITALPTGASGGMFSVKPIDKSTSSIAFVIKDAKEQKTFRASARTVPDRIVFDVLTSNLLTPFEMAPSLKALLPIERDPHGTWAPISDISMAATPQAKAAFDEILAQYGAGKTISNLFTAIDSDRRKLTQQHIPSTGYLVFTGAGGKLVCAAYIPLSGLDVGKLVIDQTLYWAPVQGEDEAIYLTGLLNSEAINAAIKEFQPRGSFGERHVHKLAHEATPPFSAVDPAHQEVVACTKQLMTEYRALTGSDPKAAKLLDPNSSALASRRSRLRGFIKELPSYEAYEAACASLYGV